jgi:hypothetical protein
MLRKVQAVAVLAAALLVINPGHAKAQQVSIEILESGLYRAETTRQVADPNAVGGTRTLMRNATFYDRTSRVPAAIGTRFGFRYRLLGVAANEDVELTKLTHFPPPGLVNPKTGRMQTSNTTVLHVKGDASPVTGFHFDEAWEAVPGEWRIELWHAGKKLAEQRYTVTR